METKKSFGEFVPAIVRVLFPRYCVKCLTLKNRPDAWRYLLGKEKELKLIDKLELSDAELAKRVWSPQTRVALLAKGNMAFLRDICNEEELDAVLARINRSNIIAAMRVYTPSHAKMLGILKRFKVDALCDFAKAVPAAFESLKPWEILGIEENTLCPADSERWSLALALAEVRPTWAPLFMLELRNIAPQHLGNVGEELMQKFFDIAFKAKADISQLMPYLYVIFPKLYMKVRDNFRAYKNFVPYFLVMFPHLVKFLEKDDNKVRLAGICFQQKINDSDEAYSWLLIGYHLLEDRKVFACFLESLRRVHSSINYCMFEELFERMLRFVPDAYDLKSLYTFYVKKVGTDTDYWLDVQHRLLEFASGKESRVNLGFAFPFTGWMESLAQRAIVMMAERKQLSAYINRLSEVSSTLRNAAFNAMETQSQIDTLATDEVGKLVTTVQLLPKAEKAFLYLLTTRNLSAVSLHELKRNYIERVQLAGSSFRALLSDLAPLSLEIRAELVGIYARKWKLSLEEYQLIMQCNMSVKAPFLREYVKNQRESAGRR